MARLLSSIAAVALTSAPSFAQIGPPPGGGGSGGGISSISTSCPSSGPFTSSTVTLNSAVSANEQTGTSYTLASTDCGKIVTLANASAVTLTLPQAGSSGFLAGFYASAIQNLGAGPVTIVQASGSTSVINGASSLTLFSGQSVGLVSDGTNWIAPVGQAVSPTPVRAGDIILWNGSNWTTLAGNNSGTRFLQESSVGAASWATVAATPGGSSGQVQINSSGAFAGEPTSGNGTTIATTSGTLTSGDCLKADANGNVTDSGAACGGTPVLGPTPSSGPGTGWYPAVVTSVVAGTQGTLNTQYCTPFWNQLAVHVDSIAFWVQTVGSSGIQLAVYSDAIDPTTKRHQPQSVYSSLTSSAIPDTTTGAQTWSFTSTSFPQGMYWICYNSADTTMPKFYSPSNVLTSILMIMGTTSAANAIFGASNSPTYGLSNAQSYGTFPTLTGVTMNDVLGSDKLPVFALHYASVP